MTLWVDLVGFFSMLSELLERSPHISICNKYCNIIINYNLSSISAQLSLIMKFGWIISWLLKLFQLFSWSFISVSVVESKIAKKLESFNLRPFLYLILNFFLFQWLSQSGLSIDLISSGKEVRFRIVAGGSLFLLSLSFTRSIVPSKFYFFIMEHCPCNNYLWLFRTMYLESLSVGLSSWSQSIVWLNATR